MKYLSNKNGFLGIDNKVNFKEKVVVVPFGLEKTVSYGGGTKNGPKEIIKASHQVELYDEELNCELPCFWALIGKRINQINRDAVKGLFDLFKRV